MTNILYFNNPPKWLEKDRDKGYAEIDQKEQTLVLRDTTYYFFGLSFPEAHELADWIKENIPSGSS